MKVTPVVPARPSRTPREWLRLALRELRGAEQAYGNHNARGGLLGAKRAAGMALRGALTAQPSEAYGRNYVQHLAALAEDVAAPEAVRQAATRLLKAAPSTVTLVILRAPRADEQLLEAARDVMAHAYALVVRQERLAAPAGAPKDEPS